MDVDGVASERADERRPAGRQPLPDALLPRPRASLTGAFPNDAVAPPVVAELPSARVPWIAGLLAFVVTLAVPLLAIAAATVEPPELRVLHTDGRVSALVADGGVRILILNSTDPRTARATLGEARPWEPRPQVIIAPSDDDAAVGLLAVVRASSPQTVIVAGIPGADPIWHALENECQQRGIDLEYTAGSLRVDGGRLTLTVFGVSEDEDEGRAVVVRRTDGGATVAVALDRGIPPVAAHALVTSGTGDDANTDLVVTTDGKPRRLTRPEVVLGFRERARIVLERDEIDVFGGTHRGGD